MHRGKTENGGIRRRSELVGWYSDSIKEVSAAKLTRHNIDSSYPIPFAVSFPLWYPIGAPLNPAPLMYTKAFT